jgi:hypothetical protein
MSLAVHHGSELTKVILGVVALAVFVVVGGGECAVRWDFPGDHSNGHVLTKTRGRSAFHSQLREVEWAVGPELTASAPT